MSSARKNGLRETFQTHTFPYWVVFATQVFLDIHHTLRDQVDRGYDDLYLIASIINQNIETTLDFHRALRVDTWPRQNDMALKQVQENINTYVMNDPIQSARLKLKRPTGKPFLLHNWHPVYCGLWLYHLQALYQEIGVVFAGAWGSILYTYHLYSALQQEKLLNHRWKDMELFMMLHNQDIFPGGRPKTPEDYLKRFTLSMGYSASSFARYRRDSGRLEASKKGPKGFQELAPVLQMFKPRFCFGSGQVDMTKQDLDKILSKSRWEVETDGKDDGDGILSMVHNNNPTEKKRQPESQQQVEAIDLLESLRNGIQAEYLEFSFDYLVLHRACWSVLRFIKVACEESLRSIYGVGCIERENQLPFLVGYIFMAATNTNKVGTVLMKKKSEEVTSKLMLQAAAACDELISTHGLGEIITRVLTEQYGLPFELEEENSSDEKSVDEM